MIWSQANDFGIENDPAWQTGCRNTNPTCNKAQVTRDNAINTIKPVLVDPEAGDYRWVLSVTMHCHSFCRPGPCASDARAALPTTALYCTAGPWANVAHARTPRLRPRPGPTRPRPGLTPGPGHMPRAPARPGPHPMMDMGSPGMIPCRCAFTFSPLSCMFSPLSLGCSLAEGSLAAFTKLWAIPSWKEWAPGLPAPAGNRNNTVTTDFLGRPRTASNNAPGAFLHA